jgi:hypothetical protein
VAQHDPVAGRIYSTGQGKEAFRAHACSNASAYSCTFGSWFTYTSWTTF